MERMLDGFQFTAGAQTPCRFPTPPGPFPVKSRMSLGTILLLVLLLMLIGALPTWPHSRSWGYYPSGGLGLVLVIVIVLVLLGQI